MSKRQQVRWFGDRVLSQVEKQAARNMDSAAIHLVNELKSELGRAPGPPRGAASQAGEPPHYRTHQLQRSHTFDRPGPLVRRVGPDTTIPHGKVVALELGSPPYEIRAKGGGFLYFQVGGHWVRTRVVHHPGLEARPWLRPVFDRERPELRRIMGRRA